MAGPHATGTATGRRGDGGGFVTGRWGKRFVKLVWEERATSTLMRTMVVRMMKMVVVERMMARRRVDVVRSSGPRDEQERGSGEQVPIAQNGRRPVRSYFRESPGFFEGRGGYIDIVAWDSNCNHSSFSNMNLVAKTCSLFRNFSSCSPYVTPIPFTQCLCPWPGVMEPQLMT